MQTGWASEVVQIHSEIIEHERSVVINDLKDLRPSQSQSTRISHLVKEHGVDWASKLVQIYMVKLKQGISLPVADNAIAKAAELIIDEYAASCTLADIAYFARTFLKWNENGKSLFARLDADVIWQNFKRFYEERMHAVLEQIEQSHQQMKVEEQSVIHPDVAKRIFKAPPKKVEPEPIPEDMTLEEYTRDLRPPELTIEQNLKMLSEEVGRDLEDEWRQEYLRNNLAGQGMELGTFLTFRINQKWAEIRKSKDRRI